ncbi:MAG: ZIP family metal transporter [Pirellulales bacterium]|jgi:zinc and cadmium transporter
MYPVVITLTIYCALIVTASLVGGWLPGMVRLTHTRMQLLMSAVGGLMLGVGVLHLLPHAAAESGSMDAAVISMLIGMVTMFFMMRVFHFHQHAPIEEEFPEAVEDEHQNCDHEAHHHHHHGHAHELDPSPMRWLGIFLGLALHTLIDGIALAASVVAATHDKPAFGLVGIGVFLGVVLHKPLDALSITFVMRASKWSPKAINLVNIGYAMMCPIGVILFMNSLSNFGDTQHYVVGCALGFSAGVFICLALGDILPEVQFHSHDRVKLSILLLVGVGVAYAIGYLEPPHLHSHQAPVMNEVLEVEK